MSLWSPKLAGVPQYSVLGPLFFLIYINDLGNNLSSTVKLFAGDASIFSIVHNIDYNDLKKISDWVYQWKMCLNPDLSKQAQEVMFSQKKLSQKASGLSSCSYLQ